MLSLQPYGIVNQSVKAVDQGRELQLHRAMIHPVLNSAKLIH
jgi:hypothetical protein